MSRPAYEEGYESYCDAGERAPLTPPHRGPKAKLLHDAEEAGKEACLCQRYMARIGRDSMNFEEAYAHYIRFMRPLSAKFVAEAFKDSFIDTAWGFEK